MHCNNVELVLELDISAEVSVLSLEDYCKLAPLPPLQPASRELHNIKITPIAVSGTTRRCVAFKDSQVDNYVIYGVRRGFSLLKLDLFRTLGFAVRDPEASNDPVHVKNIANTIG